MTCCYRIPHAFLHLPAASVAVSVCLRPAILTCRFKNPLHTTGERFVWDYWHVPDQYTLLRTPADQFFPEEQYQQLEDALLDYGEEQLGCRGISPIWLSYYVDGCRQVQHSTLLA